MQLMQNLIRPHILNIETWGQFVGHFKILDVQPHVLPNLKLHMPLCFIGIFLMLFLNLLQNWFGPILFHAF
jgi:hypothetical protein